MKVLVVVSALIACSVAASLEGTTKLVPGGVIDADPTNPAVKEAIDFAYARISASLNSAHALQFGKVVKAQSQVVSGIKYFLTIEINETDCMRGETDMSKCKVARTEVCESVVLSRPWDTNTKEELISYSCK